MSVLPGVSERSAYRIGSITKTMTAVLVLQLRDEGRLDLDDPVGRFVPECGYAEVTLRRLLSHTGGLRSEPPGTWWERSEGGSFAALTEADDGSGRVGAPGEYHYSNLGFALLGEVVARLRGQPWWETVRARLLIPLGMSSTSYLPPDDHAPACSVEHFTDVVAHEPEADTGAMAPAGQLWSTAADLLRWADFLAVGADGVLAVGTLEEMACPRTEDDAYGLGLRRVPAQPGGERVLVGHTGSMPGFQASLFVDRGTRDAVVVLADATTGLPSEQVPGLLLAEPAAEGSATDRATAPWRPSPEPLPPVALAATGLWFWGNTAFGAEWTGGELVLRDLRTAAVEERFVIDGDGFVGIDGYHRGERLRLSGRGDDGEAGAADRMECATFVYTRVPYDHRQTP